MSRTIGRAMAMTTVTFTAMMSAGAISAPDKYSLQVPDGLAFAEFKGYESWQAISVSQNGGLLAVILGNPAAIRAYRSGIPENGDSFPDGAKIAKIHWIPQKNDAEPGQPLVPNTLHDVDFMVKDSKQFTASGGWGYAAFEYDTTIAAFRPAMQADKPPQENGATCGAACHTAARARDYVFTTYQKR